MCDAKVPRPFKPSPDARRDSLLVGVRRAIYALAAILVWATDIGKTVLDNPIYVEWRDRAVDEDALRWVIPRLQEIAELSVAAEQSVNLPELRSHPLPGGGEALARYVDVSALGSLGALETAFRRAMADSLIAATVYAKDHEMLQAGNEFDIRSHQTVRQADRLFTDAANRRAGLAFKVDRRTSGLVLLGQLLAGLSCALAWWFEERRTNAARSTKASE